MNTKKILGLDLGTNSIGWALVERSENIGAILGAGSRILPMSQDVLGKFDSRVSVSQTAERTGFRGVRRELRKKKGGSEELRHGPGKSLDLAGNQAVEGEAAISNRR